MYWFARTTLVCAVTLFALAAAAAAEEEKADKLIRWKDGLWRLETSALVGTRSGNRSRTDDFNVNVIVEYEIPAGKRGTTGLRLHPLFYYQQNDPENTVWGAAVGTMIRIYEKEHVRRGAFVEIDGSVLLHSDEFRGNSARANFLLEAGIGYKFENDTHVAAKFRHLSNAGLDKFNSGINAIGLALGYTF